MRAHEYLFETTDLRSKLQKLKELIDHPNTEDTIRAVAQGKYEALLAITPLEEEPKPSRITVPVNLKEEDLDLQFVIGITVGELYENLCALNPRPSHIEFLRQGVIRMLVPPPFMGLSRKEYYALVATALPGVRNIICNYSEERGGYLFSMSYI